MEMDRLKILGFLLGQKCDRMLLRLGMNHTVDTVYKIKTRTDQQRKYKDSVELYRTSAE